MEVLLAQKYAPAMEHMKHGIATAMFLAYR